MSGAGKRDLTSSATSIEEETTTTDRSSSETDSTATDQSGTDNTNTDSATSGTDSSSTETDRHRSARAVEHRRKPEDVKSEKSTTSTEPEKEPEKELKEHKDRHKHHERNRDKYPKHQKDKDKKDKDKKEARGQEGKKEDKDQRRGEKEEKAAKDPRAEKEAKAPKKEAKGAKNPQEPRREKTPRKPKKKKKKKKKKGLPPELLQWIEFHEKCFAVGGCLAVIIGIIALFLTFFYFKSNHSSHSKNNNNQRKRAHHYMDAPRLPKHRMGRSDLAAHRNFFRSSLRGRSKPVDKMSLFSTQTGEPYSSRVSNHLRDWLIVLRLEDIRIRYDNNGLWGGGDGSPVSISRFKLVIVSVIYHETMDLVRLAYLGKRTVFEQTVKPPYSIDDSLTWQVKLDKMVRIPIKGRMLATIHDYTIQIQLEWSDATGSTSASWFLCQNLGSNNQSLAFKQFFHHHPSTSDDGKLIESLEIRYGGGPPMMMTMPHRPPPSVPAPSTSNIRISAAAVNMSQS